MLFPQGNQMKNLAYAEDNGKEETQNNCSGSNISEADHQIIEEMLKDLRENSAPTPSDIALNTLCWQDFPSLCIVCDCLSH